MPFVKKIEIEIGILGIWEFGESVDSLINAFRFSEKETAEFNKFSLEKRQSEYLATRLLLQHLMGEKTEIIYQKSGRPQIKNSQLNISISHSADLLVIFISNDLVGIDVENVNRSIERVARRFLHNNEMEWIEETQNHQAATILLWCAKEAIFKCSNQMGVQFDTHIFISPFGFGKEDFFTGKLTTQSKVENYNLWYFYFQNNIVVYCVQVENIFL